MIPNNLYFNNIRRNKSWSCWDHEMTKSLETMFEKIDQQVCFLVWVVEYTSKVRHTKFLFYMFLVSFWLFSIPYFWVSNISLTEIKLTCNKLYIFRDYNVINFDTCIACEKDKTVTVINILTPKFFLPICNPSLSLSLNTFLSPGNHRSAFWYYILNDTS